MWSFITQPGLATVILDLTNDLSGLGIGLLGLMTLAAVSIASAAIRRQAPQSAKPAVETAPTDYREAA
jgi:hypothetical protein